MPVGGSVGVGIAYSYVTKNKWRMSPGEVTVEPRINLQLDTWLVLRGLSYKVAGLLGVLPVASKLEGIPSAQRLLGGCSCMILSASIQLLVSAVQ